MDGLMSRDGPRIREQIGNLHDILSQVQAVRYLNSVDEIEG
jgi:hypothetical protein